MNKYNGDLITKGRERSNSSEKSFFIFFLSFNFQSTEQNKGTKRRKLTRYKDTSSSSLHILSRDRFQDRTSQERNIECSQVQTTGDWRKHEAGKRRNTILRRVIYDTRAHCTKYAN